MQVLSRKHWVILKQPVGTSLFPGYPQQCFSREGMLVATVATGRSTRKDTGAHVRCKGLSLASAKCFLCWHGSLKEGETRWFHSAIARALFSFVPSKQVLS